MFYFGMQFHSKLAIPYVRFTITWTYLSDQNLICLSLLLSLKYNAKANNHIALKITGNKIIHSRGRVIPKLQVPPIHHTQTPTPSDTHSLNFSMDHPEFRDSRSSKPWLSLNRRNLKISSNLRRGPTAHRPLL